MMKKVTLTLSAILFLPIIAYFILLFIAHEGNIHFLQIDRCLDRGGKWNYITNRCEYFNIIQKSWHTSPSNSEKSSNIYPFVKWEYLENIRIGIKKMKLISIIKTKQIYNHKINAIIYTESPDGIRYEVAIKLNKENVVNDVSFKKRHF